MFLISAKRDAGGKYRRRWRLRHFLRELAVVAGSRPTGKTDSGSNGRRRLANECLLLLSAALQLQEICFDTWLLASVVDHQLVA